MTKKGRTTIKITIWGAFLPKANIFVTTTFCTHGIPTGPTLNHLATAKRMSYAATPACVSRREQNGVAPLRGDDSLASPLAQRMSATERKGRGVPWPLGPQRGCPVTHVLVVPSVAVRPGALRRRMNLDGERGARSRVPRRRPPRGRRW
jgi:hypothetical protein